MQMSQRFEAQKLVTPPIGRGGSLLFRASKRGFDLFGSVVLLPILGMVIVVVAVLNPFLNKGRLFYSQQRMGRDLTPFRIYKLRTMTATAQIDRSETDPVEDHRITRLGRKLRKLRIDELPQILNVLRGDMSLIGPRPEFLQHANAYCASVPGYEQRYQVRPGISGYAQVTQGYTDDLESTSEKLKHDLYYIQNSGFRMELFVFWHTVKTVLTGFGAR